MARYINDPILGGNRYGTTETIASMRHAQKSGQIRTRTMVMQEGHRLDTLAGNLLGDSSLWWVIAILSGIGWGLQVPPGTRVTVPVSKSDIEAFL